MKTTVLMLLLLACAPAFGTDITAKCIAVPKDTAGNPLPADEVLTFKLYGAMQGQALQNLTPIPLESCLSVRTNVNPGTICYAWSEVGTRDGASEEGAQSPPACTVVLPPPVQPGVPTGVSATPVTIATTVYMELQTKDGFSFLAVGTVPLGTPCDPNQRVNFFNVVPASAVTWTGSIHRLAALAACSVTN